MATLQLFLAAAAAALLFLGGGSRGDVGAAGRAPAGRRPLRPPASSWSFARSKRDDDPPSYLKWVAFEGKLPADAVSNWNNYANRTEYVCSTEILGCNTGAYVPERGASCFYPYAGWEHSTQDFKVLVNVGGFEALDWVDDSFGSVPDNAVEGCPFADVFVGRNSYGLGKVTKEQRALFVVVDGEEVWFKWYQVLTVKKGPANVTISEVRYNMSAAVESSEVVTLMKTMVRNEGCRPAQKVVTLEENTETEHDWVIDQKVFTTIHGVLRASLLLFNGTSWEVTNVTDIPWVGGASTSEYVAHTHVVVEELKPCTACVVALEGRRLDLHVPFAARLARKFANGQHHRVDVTGWAHSRTVASVWASIQHCWTITDVPPCRQ